MEAEIVERIFDKLINKLESGAELQAEEEKILIILLLSKGVTGELLSAMLSGRPNMSSCERDAFIKKISEFLSEEH